MTIEKEFVVRLDEYDKKKNNPGASMLVRTLWQLINVVVMNSWLVPVSGWKAALLRRFGASIGRGIVIKPCVSIKQPWRLAIGDHVWLGERVWIDNVTDITIGSHVCISQGAYLLTGNHDYRDSNFALVAAEIFIEDGVWIGARSTVCPGVRVMRNSVLTVGSVLTKDTTENGVFGGNPAAFVRSRLRGVHGC